MSDFTSTNSWNESISVTCSQCGQVFDAKVWVILDNDERPDLILKAREKTLFQADCPAGHSVPLDVPLLLYSPDTKPSLIFSPAQNTPDDQNHEKCRELMDRLRACLELNPDAAILEDEGPIFVPPMLLPVILNDGPIVQLPFVERKWNKSIRPRKRVSQILEQSDLEPSEQCRQLNDLGMAYVTRFIQGGDAVDLKEAISAFQVSVINSSTSADNPIVFFTQRAGRRLNKNRARV